VRSGAVQQIGLADAFRSHDAATVRLVALPAAQDPPGASGAPSPARAGVDFSEAPFG